MKKFFIVFSIFCLFILASCSKHNEEDIFPADTGSDTSDTGTSGNDTTNTGDTNTDTADTDTGTTQEDTDEDTDSTAPDEETSDSDSFITDSDEDETTTEDDSDNDFSDSDTTDNDMTDSDDSDADDSDSAESGDEDADTDTDDSDTAESGDEDADTDTGSGEEGLHECSVNPATPCKSGNLIWSSRSAATADWGTAKSECARYKEGTFTSGWKLSTISDLRTLIINCKKTETNGNCGVTDQCVVVGQNIDYTTCYTNSSCYNFGNICPVSEEHSLLGDTSELWSASYPTDLPEHAWYVDFNNGNIRHTPTGEKFFYRCVHDAE